MEFALSRILGPGLHVVQQRAPPSPRRPSWRLPWRQKLPSNPFRSFGPALPPPKGRALATFSSLGSPLAWPTAAGRRACNNNRGAAVNLIFKLFAGMLRKNS